MRELLLLNVLRSSPYSAWLGEARLRIDCGTDQFDWSTRGVTTWAGAPVDAVLTCSPADLDRMLAKKPAEEAVRLQLGERDAPARLKHARSMLAATALGWMGPVPDPDSPAELEREVRRACLEIVIGPGDSILPLFSPAAPAEWQECRVRVTEGARRRYTTLGMADTALAAELWADGGLGTLRSVALAVAGLARAPRALNVGDNRYALTPQPLASARGTRHLLHVRVIGPAR